MKFPRINIEILTALIYLLFGGLWILLSDRLLESLIQDPTNLTNFQTYKGWLFVLSSAALIYFLLRRNLSTQRRVEKELRVTSERYRLLFDTSLDAVLLTAPDGRIFEANPAACRMFGRSEAEICEVGRKGVIDPNDPRVPPALEERTRNGQFVGELNFIRKDGSPFPCEVTSALFTDSQSQICTSMVIRDISERKQISARLAEVEENERRSLVKELHDQVGQSLTALSINLSLIRNRVGHEAPEVLAARFDSPLELVNEITDKIRSIMAELHPPVLDDYGLAAALKWFADRLQRQTGLQVRIDGDITHFKQSDSAEISFFRIAQEALNNVVKYAESNQAFIQLEETPDALLMAISDEGAGFDTLKAAQSDNGHWGLLSMRERAEAAGGQLQIQSFPGEGTKIFVRIPR